MPFDHSFDLLSPWLALPCSAAVMFFCMCLYLRCRFTNIMTLFSLILAAFTVVMFFLSSTTLYGCLISWNSRQPDTTIFHTNLVAESRRGGVCIFLEMVHVFRHPPTIPPAQIHLQRG